MYLSELFETEINEYAEKDATFYKILDLVLHVMDNGAHFTEALDLLSDRLGHTNIHKYYPMLRNEIKSGGGRVIEGTESDCGCGPDCKCGGSCGGTCGDENCPCDCDKQLDEKMAWGRKGNKVVRKFRCMSGRKKGKTVNKPGDCYKPVDMKKRATFKKTKARMGKRMARKAKKTKRINPASKRVKALNK